MTLILLALICAGCSDSGNAANPDVCQASGPGKEPPAPDPHAPLASGTTPTILAVKRLYLDDQNAGKPTPDAWKHVGYDVDGLISQVRDCNHCRLQPGASPSMAKPDGDDGIDNSFGKNLTPIISIFDENASDATTGAIAAGHVTWLFDLTNLGLEPNQNGVIVRFYRGADRGAPATFHGDDVWPVTAESVVAGNLNDARVSMPDGYVVNDVWVSGQAPLVSVLGMSLMSSFELPLRIHDARVTLNLVGAGSNATAEGIISGVLDTEELVNDLYPYLGYFDPAVCFKVTFEAIAQEVRQASDLMKDGSNGDPSQTCDGISIGLKFDAVAAKLGTVEKPVKRAPGPCQ